MAATTDGNRSRALWVMFNDELVGVIHDSEPLSFQYSTTWLSQRPMQSIAAIPLRAEPTDGIEVQAFFENLLPEGELRDYISDKNKATTLYSLLRQTAGDTAGGFVIVPAGQKTQAPAYEKTSWSAIARALNSRSACAIDLRGRDARISLAGAQDKASIAIFADGIPSFPRGVAPSTHILKPNIKRLAKVWNSAANEAITMRMAAHCALPTAEVFYEPITASCIVKRFDRVEAEDSSIRRLIQYDICQFAGILSQRKYEKEGGPGLSVCAEIIRRYSDKPLADLHRLVQWVFFNLYVGNNDSHAKNLSLFNSASGAVTLTPFYDLMCTRLYPGLSSEFAFAVGGEVMPGKIDRRCVEAFAKDIGVSASYVLRSARELAERIPSAVEQAVDELTPLFEPGAKTMAEKLKFLVLSNTRKTAQRIAR